MNLLKHQLKPIEYIISKCPNQHGLILNHYLGTGKTLIGLSIFQLYKKYKKILVAPKAVINVWILEAEKYNIDISDVQLIKLEEFKKDYEYEMMNKDSNKAKKHKKNIEMFKNSICIVDEAHNLYNIINDAYDEFYDNQDKYIEYEKKHHKNKKEQINLLPQLLSLFEVFNSTKKILLMTGTLYNSKAISEFRYLVNLAAGKTVVPYSESLFLNKYEKIFMIDRIYRQVLVPFIKYNPLYILPSDLIKFLSKGLESKNFVTFLYLLYKPTKNAINEDSIDESNIFSVFNFNNKQKIKDIKLHPEKIFEPIDNQKEKNPYTFQSQSKFINTSVNVNLQNKKNFTIDVDKFKMIGNNLFSRLINLANISYDILLNNRSILLEFLLVMLISHVVHYVFTYIKDYYEARFLYLRLDYNKLKKDNVDRYISYYDYRFMNDKNYPQKIEYINRVNYTSKQLILLIKYMFVQENLTSSDLVDLEIYPNLLQADIFRHDYNIQSKFKANGTIIGNLYNKPNKFIDILKIYKKNKKQTVLYSNFYEKGILLFSKFLTSNNINHSILSDNISESDKNKILNDFKNEKTNFLLLHPNYYQGISLIGCRYLHILEPIKNINVREQLYGRVIRFRSHEHLKLRERNVKIYQWGCTLLYDINKILHNVTFAKELFNSFDKNKTIYNMLDVFKSNLSPDDKLISLYNVYINSQNSFNDVIKHLNIDNSNISLKCCIWNDSKCSKLPMCDL